MFSSQTGNIEVVSLSLVILQLLWASEKIRLMAVSFWSYLSHKMTWDWLKASELEGSTWLQKVSEKSLLTHRADLVSAVPPTHFGWVLKDKVDVNKVAVSKNISLKLIPGNHFNPLYLIFFFPLLLRKLSSPIAAGDLFWQSSWGMPLVSTWQSCVCFDDILYVTRSREKVIDGILFSHLCPQGMPGKDCLKGVKIQKQIADLTALLAEFFYPFVTQPRAVFMATPGLC